MPSLWLCFNPAYLFHCTYSCLTLGILIAWLPLIHSTHLVHRIYLLSCTSTILIRQRSSNSELTPVAATKRTIGVLLLEAAHLDLLAELNLATLKVPLPGASTRAKQRLINLKKRTLWVWARSFRLMCKKPFTLSGGFYVVICANRYHEGRDKPEETYSQHADIS